MKILIAGIGNELRGDDGFGQRVIKRLQSLLSSLDVDIDDNAINIMDFGQHTHELLLFIKDYKYDVIIIIDAIEGDGNPGDLYFCSLNLINDVEVAEGSIVSNSNGNENNDIIITEAVDKYKEIINSNDLMFRSNTSIYVNVYNMQKIISFNHNADLKMIFTVLKKLKVHSKIFIIGCHPENTDLKIGLSKKVEERVDDAVKLILRILKVISSTSFPLF